MKKTLLAAALLLIAAVPLRKNESLTIFPTYGVRTPDGGWRVAIHMWLYEPELHSPLRNVFLDALETAIPEVPLHSPLFEERLRPFLRDSDGGKRLPLRIDGTDTVLPATAPGGHVRAEVSLPPTNAGRVGLSVGPFKGDARVFRGWALLVPPDGLSVVSDIDDTLKISEVRDRKRLLARTFAEPFAPVDGMAALYRSWAAKGAVFHYVSASPWQMGEVLTDFLSREGFPGGTLCLKDFRMTDKTVANLFAAPDVHKDEALGKLFGDFPRRRFILVGDDGERDPEIYARAAREHPGQVEKIFIRLAYGRTEDPRFAEAFRGLPRDLWTVFKDPAEIRR